jgi:hypothetical protein
MGTGRELVLANARRKGEAALGVGLLTVGLAIAAASIGGPFLAAATVVAGGVVTARRTLDWLRYRGTWGLRF